jgi:hypothetical protein
MTNILITLIAIAAFLVIRAMCDAVRFMQYHLLKAKRDRMSLQELREDLDRQYYSQNMKEIYGRIKDL